MNIVGHTENLKRLFDIAASGRPAQAYIFYGQEGIGKKLAAFEFAKSGFCTGQRSTKAPCGTCMQCLKIDHGNHPDISYVELTHHEKTGKLKKEISIDQTRDVISFSQMSPVEAPFKVVIIDNAEEMSQSAANSLLKTLEEPPTSTTFILVTSRLNRLLPTILSRSQKFSFSVPPVNESIKVVAQKKGISENDARLLLSICGGSIGLAYDFDLMMQGDVVSTLRKIRSERSPTLILETADRWGGKKADRYEEVLSSILFVHYEALMRKHGKRSELPQEAEGLANELARELSISSLSEKVNAIMTARNEAEGTYNKQLMFEQLLFTLII